jgi:hypothetical protein
MALGDVGLQVEAFPQAPRRFAELAAAAGQSPEPRIELRGVRGPGFDRGIKVGQVPAVLGAFLGGLGGEDGEQGGERKAFHGGDPEGKGAILEAPGRPGGFAPGRHRLQCVNP